MRAKYKVISSGSSFFEKMKNLLHEISVTLEKIIKTEDIPKTVQIFNLNKSEEPSKGISFFKACGKEVIAITYFGWGKGVMVAEKSPIVLFTDSNQDCPILIALLKDPEGNRYRFLSHLINPSETDQIECFLKEISKRNLSLVSVIFSPRSDVETRPDQKKLQDAMSQNLYIVVKERLFPDCSTTVVAEEGWMIQKHYGDSSDNNYMGGTWPGRANTTLHQSGEPYPERRLLR